MKNGASGYLGTITATGPGFSFQVYGSKGSLRLEGMTHVAGRLVRGTPHAPVQHGEVAADQGAGRDVGGRAARRHPCLPRSVRHSGLGRHAFPDSDQRDDSWRLGHRGRGEIGPRRRARRNTFHTGEIHGFGQGPGPPHVLHAGAPDRQLGSALEERQHVSASGEGTHRAGPEVRCLPAHLGALGRAPLRGAVQAR